MSEITTELQRQRSSDENAADRLLPLVYAELRRLAEVRMGGEFSGHTLQPTALVHEAYLRLTSAAGDGSHSLWENRGHFFAAAAEAMRRILIESARRKGRERHGGDHVRVPLDPNGLAEPESADELLALDEALTAFSQVEPQIADLVKLRFFGGMTLKDSAAALGIAPRTADAHWAYARAWLLAAMRDR